MLERVPLLELDLAAYEPVAGSDAIDRILALAEPLRGARVLHLNATPYGGGVAELLATHVPLLRSVGIDAEWQVIQGSDQFFHVTKSAHNALQGDRDVPWTRAMEHLYLQHVLESSLALEGEWDFVVVHDPQPAAILSFLSEARANRGRTRWVWRCHIDLTDARPDVWEFFRPFVEAHDASVWTMEQFVPDSLGKDRVRYAPPCIDPRSVKNLDLAEPFCVEICRSYGIDARRPIMCQVSRFDPWKDPLGVIEAYRLVREEVPDVQLVLAGSMATDDPESFQIWEQTEQARAGDPSIHMLSNIQQVGSVQINAFQRTADVVIQKSLREGFGLTVSEALWKGRPVVGGRAGGICLQIREGVDGYLVSSVEECARRTLELLGDPARADALGANGREHVRENFLSTREVEDWLALMTELRA